MRSFRIFRRRLDQLLKLRQLTQRRQVGVIAGVLEVVVAGGDGFLQTGQRQVDVSLPASLLFLGQRLTFSRLNSGGTQAIRDRYVRCCA
jgi:hypothetical protein